MGLFTMLGIYIMMANTTNWFFVSGLFIFISAILLSMAQAVRFVYGVMNLNFMLEGMDLQNYIERPYKSILDLPFKGMTPLGYVVYFD